MDNFLLELVLSNPWMKDLLITVGIWVSLGLTLAGVAHTFAVGVLRPLAKYTPGDWDDKIVSKLVWWTDAVSDILREWAFGKWVVGWERAKRMWVDKNEPLSERRWE